jgi:hypothetical protein
MLSRRRTSTNGLARPQSSSRYRLAPSLGRAMQSLRSSSITEPSTLLRTAPPLCPALVLWSSQFQPLGLLPSHRDDRFSRSVQEPDPASRRLYAGCRSGSLQDYSRTRPGSSTRPRFRHHPWHFDTSSAVRSRSPLRTIPDGIKSRLLLQRSPPSLLTTAACSGLTPAPDRRRRGAHPHLSYSATPSFSEDVFVTHRRGASDS